MLVTVLALVATALGGAPGVASSSFVVTTTDDVADADPSDGVCDDGAGRCSIRAAVEQANATGGATEITIPAGTYTISGTIAVTSDVTLLGAGVGDTQLRPGVDGDMFELDGGASFALHDTDVDAANGTGRRNAALTVVTGADASVFLSDVHVRNNAWTAMFAEGWASDRVHVEVVRSQFTNVEYPIFFAEGADQYLDVRESTFSGSGYSAVFIDSVSGSFTVADSEILETTGSGIEAWNDQSAPARGTELTVLRTRIAGSTGTFASGVNAVGTYAGGQPTMVIDVLDSEITDSEDFGLYLDGDVTVERSTISRNGSGGGLLEGPVTIRESTFSDNSEFGAELNRAEYPAEVVNSTFSGNQGYAGLAVWKDSAQVQNVTIAGTTDPSEWDEGAGLATSSDGVVVQNTVIADNEVDCEDGTFFTSSHTADSDGTCALTGPGDQSGVDALLGPLVDNGGPSETRLPSPLSPLVDAGDPDVCPATDQRGVARPQDGDGDGTTVCDIGAVERAQTTAGATSTFWSSTVTRRGMLDPDDVIEVTVTGPADGSGTASIEVESWYEGGDPAGALLAAPVTATIDLLLVEGPPGAYTGELPLHGVTTVKAVTGQVVTPGGTPTDTTTDGLPRVTGGVLDLALDVQGDPALLPNLRAALSSSSTGDGDVVPLTDGAGATRVLAPAADYHLRLLDDANHTLADVAGPVTVRGGLHSAVTETVAPVFDVPFTVTVVDGEGQPIPEVTVRTSDPDTGEELTRARTNSAGVVATTSRGATVEVVVTPSTQPYAGVNERITLTSPGQNMTITLPPVAPIVTITGTVTYVDGAPARGLEVLVHSIVESRTFSRTATTDDVGRYAVDVPAGAVTAFASHSWAGGATATATVTDDAAMDLVLDTPEPVLVDLDLSTRLVGQTVATPVDLTSWRAVVHFDVEVSQDGNVHSVRQFPAHLPLDPTRPVEICVDGHEGGLPAACVDATVDVGAKTAMGAIELVQAARLTGELTVDGVAVDSWAATTYRIDAAGSRTLVDHTSRHRRSRLDVAFDTAGAHEVHVIGWTAGGGTGAVTLPVTLPDNDTLDLGAIELSTGGRFGDGSTVTLGSTTVLPGGIVTARVAASLAGTSPVTPRLDLLVPGGTSVVPGSITLDGVTVPATESDGWLQVHVPAAMQPGDVAVLQAWLRVDADAPPSTLVVRGRAVHDGGEEHLGLASASVPEVTLTAPATTPARTVSVSGRAPAGSAVTVTADREPIAIFTAAEGGVWSGVIELPATPLPRTWDLAAHVDEVTTTLRSASHAVRFDPYAVDLESVVLQQSDGRVVRIDPDHGMARFPYVFAPGRPFEVRLTFNDPGRVSDVRVALGDVSAPAVFDSGTQSYLASLSPEADELGPVAVSWDSTSVPIDITPAVVPPPLSESEVAAQLKAPFDTFELLDLADPAGGPTVITTALPHFGEAELRIEATATDGDYEPTSEDLAIQEATGSPVYVLDHGLTFPPDDPRTAEFSLRVFVPDDAAPVRAVASDREGGAPRTAMAAGAAAGKVVDIVADLTMVTGYNAEQMVQIAAGAGSAAATGAGLPSASDPWDQLAELSAAIGSCSPETLAAYQDRLDQMAHDLMFQFGVNVVLTVIGLATGPIGAVALAVGGYAADQALAGMIQRRITGIATAIANDPECQPEPPTPPEPPEVPVADPVWIHDPSGFVYELFPDQPIVGVTATVQHAPAPDGPWTIWDAEWFGQENPQTTGSDGRYGWDVPEGWWRVRFDKDGYETAYSDVLQVLPPHFDVDVGMKRLAAPSVATIEATDGDRHVDVTFDSFVATRGLDVQLGLLDGAGTPLAVTVTPVDPRGTGGAAEADTVANVVRLELSRALAAGEELTVVVDRLVTSYAGIPAGDDLAQTITVAAAPAEPVVPEAAVADATTPEGDGGTTTVDVTVTLSEPAPAMVDLAWSTADDTAIGGADYEVASGRLTIPAGATTGTVAVAVIGDTVPEDDERFLVVLSDPTGASLGDADATVTIRDDDALDTPGNRPPTIDLGDVPRLADTHEPVRMVAAVADPDGDDLTVTWELGDGSPPLVGNPVEHVFAAPGRYTVTAMVSDGSSEASDTVDVEVVDSGHVTRTAGADRIHTAVQVSREYWPAGVPAGAAVLARADVYSDALAAGPFAANLDAPLLLTQATSLPALVAEELERLGVSTVWLLGGSSAISPDVEATLEGLGYATERIAGVDRFATAAAVARRVGASDTGEVVLALGAHDVPDRGWPDALAAGALSASPDRLPVLLTAPGAVPAATVDALDHLDPTTVWILGGPAAVSDGVVERLTDLGYTVRRLAGTTRYETSVAVAEEALSRHGDGQVAVVFATGEKFPDGLSAGALAARLGAIVLLVPPAEAPDATAAFLTTNAPTLDRGVLLGGTAAVSEAMRWWLAAAIGAPATQSPLAAARLEGT